MRLTLLATISARCGPTQIADTTAGDKSMYFFVFGVEIRLPFARATVNSSLSASLAVNFAGLGIIMPAKQNARYSVVKEKAGICSGDLRPPPEISTIRGNLSGNFRDPT